MNTPSRRFDASNPEHLRYDCDLLEIAVLGGIRLEGLDSMRTTLKIQAGESGTPALRHHLDLYNDTQVEKLIRKTADKLGVGTSLIGAALADLTEILEQYRLAQREKEHEDREKIRSLTEQARREAEHDLSAPDLLRRTGEGIGRTGVIGEEDNRLLMYLIFTTRKREHPLHVISLGSSGIGKTHLQEKVSALIPEEDKIELTSLSGNAFYYFGKNELRNKLILIEDLDGAEHVLYPLRELQSKRRIAKTVAYKNTRGETRSIRLAVEGPVCVSGCTTQESLYEDNANRSFLIYIDESPEQDERVMDYQRKLSAGKIDQAEQRNIIRRFQNIQRVLRPIAVRNPYAEYLRIPPEVFKPRRTNAHYLAFIEAVTFYHQYQREKNADQETGEEYIETTLEDIEQANRLIKNILLRKADTLSGPCRNFFERMKEYLKTENKNTFTNKEIRGALREKHGNQKRYMSILQQNGMIGKIKGDQKNGFNYRVTDEEEYKKLRSNIENVLDDTLQNLRKRFNGSKRFIPENEPLNPKKTKALKQEVHQNQKTKEALKNEAPSAP